MVKSIPKDEESEKVEVRKMEGGGNAQRRKQEKQVSVKSQGWRECMGSHFADCCWFRS